MKEQKGHIKRHGAERERHSRRSFMANGARAGIVTGMAIVTQEAHAVSETSKGTRYGMIIDLKKCVGCGACVAACKAENHTPPGVVYNVVMEEEIGTYPYVRRQFMPCPCMQCQEFLLH